MKIFSIATFILFLFAPVKNSWAQASASASFKASVTIIEPIGISTKADMSFARVDAREGGTVVLNPDNSRQSIGDAVLEQGGSVTAATFEVTGQQGYAFAITLPKGQARVINGSESMILQNFTTDYDGSPLGGNSQEVRVGASLHVNPNQQPGFYQTDKDLQVTVNYN